MPKTIEERFWEKVAEGPLPPKRPELGPCQLWTASTGRGGYGLFSVEGRLVVAHRWAFERWVRPLVDDEQAHHRCEVTACVRLDHLRAETPRGNLMASDTPARRNAEKTHCVRGHDFAEHGYRRKNGARGCRECDRRRWKQAGCEHERIRAADGRLYCPTCRRRPKPRVVA